MTLLQHYAGGSCVRHAEATAVVLGEERLSYRRLVGDARRLAHELRDRGVRRGDRVALFLAKSPMAIVAIHGVLEAGAAYVPVDPHSPFARVRLILEAAQPAAILTTAAARPGLAALALDGVSTVLLDEDPWPERPEEPLGGSGKETDLAHLLFTSGSTGIPKGVQITHAMACAFIDWAVAKFGTQPGERISGHPPLHFDLSTFDIYATLSAGAELHLVPQVSNLHPRSLAQFIRDSQLTQWFSVPSTLAFMAKADVIAEHDFPALRRVLFCGEAMPAPVLAHWMRRVPHVRYTNLYGPTEATIASSYHDFGGPPVQDDALVPIGVPCPGEEILVLDADTRPCPPGHVGELYIGGVGVSPGYWRDPARTAAAFTTDPRNPARRLYRTGDLGWLGEDGLLYFSGRADAQIKHRGYRIELGEIESALNTLAGIRECAVVATVSDGFEGTTICCAYSPTLAEVTHAGVRRELTQLLPAYMLPTRWAAVEALPKNDNGKIDRRAVRQWFAAPSEPAT